MDFSNWKTGYRHYDGADKKISLINNGVHYIVKFPNEIQEKGSLNSSYSNNVVSEYISCRIIKETGLPVQDVMLGTYHGVPAVACRDFSEPSFKLHEFSKFQNSYLGGSKIGRTPRFEDLTEIMHKHSMLQGRQDIIDRYWDIFVIDGFLGNFDRHAGNWGYLVNEDTGELKNAPVYDCASCLYPQISDTGIERIIQSRDEINKRIFDFPKAALSINDKKVSYHELIGNTDFPECGRALCRMMPVINKIDYNKIVDDTEGISDIRKSFYKTMLKERKEQLLDKAYEKAKSEYLEGTKKYQISCTDQGVSDKMMKEFVREDIDYIMAREDGTDTFIFSADQLQKAILIRDTMIKEYNKDQIREHNKDDR